MGPDRSSGAPLMLYASVQIRADEVVTLLLKGLPSFALELLTRRPSSGRLARWLITQRPLAGFSASDETELKTVDESKAVVPYAPTR